VSASADPKTMEPGKLAGTGADVKATLIAQVLISGLLLTACGGANIGNTESGAPSIGSRAGALTGVTPESTSSSSPDNSAVTSTAETTDTASPSSSTKATIASPSASPSATQCALKPGATCDGADLTGLDLSGVDLSGISLIGAKLTGTNLSSANLSNARLTGANITGAIWKATDLTGATTGFDALDPSLQSATTCRTRMANGVIDSRGCPCRNVGGATAGSDPWLGSIGLGAIPNMPREYARAEGELVSLRENQALFSLLGAPGGGYGSSNFALPQVSGPWAGVRTGKNGDGKCLQWSVAIRGWFANAPVKSAFPGEIYLSAVTGGYFRGEMTEAGARIDPTISSYLGKGFTAYAIPSTWPTPGDAYSNGDTYMAELRLFTTSQPLPSVFVPADGSAISSDKNPELYDLLGSTLPLVVAPDGYQWAVATDGIYPS